MPRETIHWQKIMPGNAIIGRPAGHGHRDGLRHHRHHKVLLASGYPAARRHFATALPLIVQLQTAPQALECLAGLTHVAAQSGQQEDALAMVTLALHHPSTFQETKDRLTELHARLVAALPPAIVEAVRTHGLTSHLSTVPADLLIQLT